MAAVESLVLVQEVVPGNESAIDVALTQINRYPAVMLNLFEALTRASSKYALEDEKSSVAENYMASHKSRMSAGLIVEYAGHLVSSVGALNY